MVEMPVEPIPANDHAALETCGVKADVSEEM